MHEVPEEYDEIRRLLTENMKLKHRLAVLKRAIEAEEGTSAPVQPKEKKLKTDTLPNIMEFLENIFTISIHKSCSDIVQDLPPVAISLSGSNPKFGDYQCNSAMALSQIYKAKEKKMAPREIATKIMENTPKHPLIEKLEVAGAGFINIFLNKSIAVECLTNILKNGIQPPEVDQKCRILVDFPSPNIAKEMHVGHLR